MFSFSFIKAHLLIHGLMIPQKAVARNHQRLENAATGSCKSP
jgi:hypothetical protein